MMCASTCLRRIAAATCCCQEKWLHTCDQVPSSGAQMQGIAWLYDYTFGNGPDLMQACFQAGVEYMPMVVRTPN